MVAILGISAFYHDSAAALLVDGTVVAAAQEERFSRVKHDEQFPSRAVDFCLQQGGLQPQEIDYVGFYEKPFRKFQRLMETYLHYAPRGYSSYRKALPQWSKRKLHLRRVLDQHLQGRYRGPYVFPHHHESHAASAFFPSPFSESTIITSDGVGEWATSCIGYGEGNKFQLSQEMRFPHSLGLLYSAFTYYLGFEVNGGEYKLMGLAPYGDPVYKDLILERLLDLKPDGSFRMDMSYFRFAYGLTMTSPNFHRLLGGPPRKPEADITLRHMDLAASIQSVTEEIMLRVARHAHVRRPVDNLVMAGGVALNCVANGRLLRETPYQSIWVQPAAGDAGGALGVAWFVWHQLLGRERRPLEPDQQYGSLLGPEYPEQEIIALLREQQAVFDTYPDDESLCREVAALVDQQQVVGWFQGRMEFGPRALGARSIVADARSPEMQSTLNLKIKFRESFRPFAPVVLREAVHDWFEMSPGEESPYMLFVAHVRGARRTADRTQTVGQRLGERRSRIPAVTHVDGSARVQTVDARRSPLLHRLLEAFRARTGCPVMINTSFNVRDEPIVCSPLDAYRCFWATGMDALVMGRTVLRKDRQPADFRSNRSHRSPVAPKTKSGWLHIDRRPTPRKLRQFAGIAFLVLPLVAAVWAPGRTVWLIASLATGFLAVLVSWLRPRWLSRVYIALSVATAPIGMVVAELMLFLSFFGVLAPMGLTRRLRGRHSLEVDQDKLRESYWHDVRDSRQGEDSYFRQY